jgi:hypothetical protein
LILKKLLSIQFLLLLEFAAYKTTLLSHSNIVQNISIASTTKEKEKQKKIHSKRRLLVSAVEN